jgi:hypothetical protein
VSRRAWIAIAAAAWAVALVVAGIFAARNGEPTVREQTTIVDALPTLDRAVAAVVQAAAGPRVAVAVGGYERTDDGCSAGNRDGERYERVATVYTTPGEEAAMIDRISAGLPDSYGIRVRHSATHTLRGDAGFYVALRGGVTSPGELTFAADTGCRVPGGRIPVARAATAPPAASDVLDRLGVSAGQTVTFAMACPSGRELGAVEVVAAKPTGPLAAALPAGVAPIIARADLVVYERDGVGVAARVGGGGLRVTAATGCQ